MHQQLNQIIWINLTNMILSERRQIQKTAFHVTPFIGSLLKKKKQTIHVLKSQVETEWGHEWALRCADIRLLDQGAGVCSVCENTFSDSHMFCAFFFF